MATYNQYSEVVAAYGYTTPPPPPAQANRIGLALLYAAVGVALGTMTGTTMAVVSMQNTNGLAWPHSLAMLRPVAPAAPNAHKAVVSQNGHAIVAAAPAASAKAETAQAQPAPVQTMQSHAAAPAPAAASAQVAAPVQATAPKPSLLSKIAPTPVVEASVDIDSPGLPAHAATAPAKITPVPAVHKANLETASVPVARKHSVAPAKPAVLSMPESIAPPSTDDVTLDEHVAAATAIFYSEGDAAVMDYDASAGTIVTNDGKTFMIGPTVSMADAPTWDDYRANVHYRCDQGGKCSLVRTGVVALNARMI
jgi:hypothetical protein